MLFRLAVVGSLSWLSKHLNVQGQELSYHALLRSNSSKHKKIPVPHTLCSTSKRCCLCCSVALHIAGCSSSFSSIKVGPPPTVTLLQSSWQLTQSVIIFKSTREKNCLKSRLFVQFRTERGGLDSEVCNVGVFSSAPKQILN